MKDLDEAFDNVASVRDEDDNPQLNPDVLPVKSEQAKQAAKEPKRHNALKLQVTALSHRLDVVRRNFALLLIYMTVFLDFIGITLLSPGMRFMIDPTNAGAFDDIRISPECVELLANSTTPVAGCEPSTVLQPGAAISIMMFSYGIGQLFSGALMGWSSDRFGPRRVLIVSTAGSAAAFALQG